MTYKLYNEHLKWLELLIWYTQDEPSPNIPGTSLVGTKTILHQIIFERVHRVGPTPYVRAQSITPSLFYLLLKIVNNKKNNSRYHSEYPLNYIGYVSFSLNSYKFIRKILNIIVNIVILKNKIVNIVCTTGLVLGMAVEE